MKLKKAAQKQLEKQTSFADRIFVLALLAVPALMLLQYLAIYDQLPFGLHFDVGDDHITEYLKKTPGAVFTAFALVSSAFSIQFSMATSRKPNVRLQERWAADRFTKWCEFWVPDCRKDIANLEAGLRYIKTPEELSQTAKRAKRIATQITEHLGNGKTEWGNIRTSDARLLFPTEMFESYIALAVNAFGWSLIDPHAPHTISVVTSHIESLHHVFRRFADNVTLFDEGSWLEQPED